MYTNVEFKLKTGFNDIRAKALWVSLFDGFHGNYDNGSVEAKIIGLQNSLSIVLRLCERQFIAKYDRYGY